jgi:hypothetical protein
MKIFIQQYLSYLLPCFKVVDEPQQPQQPTLCWEGGQSLVNATPVPMPIHSPIPVPIPYPIHNPIPNTIDCDSSFFLINKPSIYNKMKEDFINYHGIGSDKVKDLIFPEIDLTDRAFNIHCITGSSGHMPQSLYKTLRIKNSLSNMSSQTTDMDISDMTSRLSDSSYSSILNNPSSADAIKIAIDLVSS